MFSFRKAIDKLHKIDEENYYKPDMREEKQRRKSQYVRMLELFQTYHTLTNIDLANSICFRYSARIGELRHDGYIIVANYVRPGVFEYTYKGHKDD